MYPYMVSIANPESPFCQRRHEGCKTNGWNVNCKETQRERGQWYYEQISQWLNNYRGSDGYGFMVGVSWWQLTDNQGEQTNFGLVTLRDNLYDGMQTRPESTVDDGGVSRGGERQSYGAFTPWVRNANQCWWNPVLENCAAKSE